MPQFPYTYIVYQDDTQIDRPIVAQNSETGMIEFQGEDAASVLRQTFAENHSILVKAGTYNITTPLDLQTGMALVFEPGVSLLVPNGYDEYVFGFGERLRSARISGGFIREIQAGGPGDRPQHLWQGVRMLDNAGEGGDDGIRNNVIEGLVIWDADVAIELLITHPLGWINANVFRNLTMWRCNRFIDFVMSDEIPSSGRNGFNRNLFLNILGQASENTAFGVRGIRHRGNSFVDVKLIDFPENNPSAISASIHADAEDTLILGSTMTVQNFDDQGDRTQIIDLDRSGHRQLFLDRLCVEGVDIKLNNEQGQEVLLIDGQQANLRMGGNGANGDLFMFRTDGDRTSDATATVHLDGQQANLWMGGNGADGDLLLNAANGERRIHLDAGGGGPVDPNTRVYIDGPNGNMTLGGDGADGDLLLNAGNGERRIHLDAGGGPVDPNTRVYIDGVNGDIVLQNGDCAEDFDAADGDLEPGTVVVINEEVKLEPSRKEYDKRVAGVVAGAGSYQPGIILGRRVSGNRQVPVALVGKTCCKVDAQYGEVEVGDLLTTSPTYGHAMKATDPLAAFGSVIGKALGKLPTGTGMVPVLVALQ